jgi:hypothetical protein
MKLLQILNQENCRVRTVRRIRLFEICFLIIFAAILLSSIVSSLVLDLSGISLILLLIDLPVVAIIAIYGSLSIREEEEEKT